MGAPRLRRRLRDLADVVGVPALGRSPVDQGNGTASWTDVATQAELDAETTRAKAAEVDRPSMFFWRSGRFVWPPGYTSTSGAAVANRIYVHPIWLSAAHPLSSLAAHVITLSAGTGVLALYSDDLSGNGYPKTLLVGGLTIDTSTAGLKEVAISGNFTPPYTGWYWCASSYTGTPTLQQLASNGLPDMRADMLGSNAGWFRDPGGAWTPPADLTPAVVGFTLNSSIGNMPRVSPRIA